MEHGVTLECEGRDDTSVWLDAEATVGVLHLKALAALGLPPGTEVVLSAQGVQLDDAEAAWVDVVEQVHAPRVTVTLSDRALASLHLDSVALGASASRGELVQALRHARNDGDSRTAWALLQSRQLCGADVAADVALGDLVELATLEGIESMHRHGIPPTAVDSDATPLLHRAVSHDAVETVRALLADGADPAQRDGFGQTAVHAAVRTGVKAMMELLVPYAVTEKETIINALDRFEDTALHIACDVPVTGDAAAQCCCVKMLLELGASVEVRNAQGFTPLHNAARSGNADVVQQILAAGASTACHDTNGRKPLEHAYLQGHVESVRLIVAAMSQAGVAMTIAVPNLAEVPDLEHREADHLEIVECLLAHGATVFSQVHSTFLILHWAAHLGHLSVVRHLIAMGATADCEDQHSRLRPLHFATMKKRHHVMEYLLQCNANPRAPGPSGQTPVHYAAESGCLDSLRLLERYNAKQAGQNNFGAALRRWDDDGMTVLHYAIKHRHVPMVEALLKYRDVHRLVNRPNARTNFPLHAAVRVNSPAIVRLLLDVSGTTSDPQDARGRTPLHISADLGHTACTMALLEHGNAINPNVADAQGWTALSCAVESGHLGDLEAILAHTRTVPDAGGAEPPLLSATDRRDAEMVEALVRAGADPTKANTRGFTALQRAAKHGDVGSLALFLEARPDLDVQVKCFRGYTPCHEAAIVGAVRVVEQLLAHSPAGQDVVNARTVKNETPLLFAVVGRHVATVACLLRAGADPNVQDTPLPDGFMAGKAGKGGKAGKAGKGGKGAPVRMYGRTVLHAAVLQKGDSAPLVKHLLRYGAAVDVKDESANTPLHCAAGVGHPACVTALLDAPAAAAVAGWPDSAGNTPLQVARREGHAAVATLLERFETTVRPAQ
eukprot:TRINITY_DN25203_c0_g1_i1.p1 TRINITY_DN25203_c0_g1~~TRINITY_DN25203_c0_g1_i1.p1  ORF type:complete len:919 (+),score=234.70 TRINITY_DN25203_c0_g1_i1:65-2758(+)